MSVKNRGRLISALSLRPSVKRNTCAHRVNAGVAMGLQDRVFP